MQGKLKITLIVVVVLLLIGVGLFVASKKSEPGDFLYPLKLRFTDQVTTQTSDPQEKIDNGMKLMADRFVELKRLSLKNETVSTSTAEGIAWQVDATIQNVTEAVASMSDEMLSPTDKINTLQRLNSYAIAQNELVRADSDLVILEDMLQSAQYKADDALSAQVDLFIASSTSEAVDVFVGNQVDAVMNNFDKIDDPAALRKAQRYMTKLNESLVAGNQKEAVMAVLNAKTVTDVEGYMADNGDFELDVEMPAEGEPMG